MEISNIKYALKNKMLLPKAKKLNVSKELLELLIYREDNIDAKEILTIIKKSKNKNEFKNNIIEYLRNNPSNSYCTILLLGMFLEKYNLFYVVHYYEANIENILNFAIQDKKDIIEIFRSHLLEYIMEDNSIKNSFAANVGGIRNLSKDVDYDEVIKLFDDIINGEEFTEYDNKIWSIYQYIFTILNNYPIDDIKNNFDFIKYDLKTNNDKPLDERRDNYLKNKDIKDDTKIKLNNIDLLKDRLNRINNEEAKQLLERLNSISNNPNEIDDINLDYEILFRNDIVNRLFVPTNPITIIEDFRDVKPQLIHCFIRTTKKFRERLENEIKEKIISERNYKTDNLNLTEEEQKQFEQLLNRLDAQLDQTMVNYSFDSSVGTYTDPSGLSAYKSDTNNQISASVYSDSFFNQSYEEMIGIGFNSEGIVPESIAISSPTYLTTNKGLNNIEYDPISENGVTSACYDELIKNDGKSEIILFRNNIDYDTKASYVFVAYDSQYNENYQDLINEGKELVAKNPGMKLVLYDLVKIRESYQKYCEETMADMNTEEKSMSR